MSDSRHPDIERRPEAEGLHVLVVDDHDANRKIMDILLTEVGCHPVLLGSGEEAVERAAATAFDLILMDIHMPGVDGDEATRRIRAGGASKGAYILRWTTDAAVRFEPGLYDGEAPKSMTMPALGEMITEACRRASSRRGGRRRPRIAGASEPAAKA